MSAIVHVVDDDASFRTSISQLLRHCGYAVESYEFAEQLLKRLPDNAGVSCILLDIKIPGLSGPCGDLAMMGSAKIYGYGVAVVCAVIAAVHAPDLTHHLHWKATIIWVVVAAIVAVVASAFLPGQGVARSG